MDQQDVTLGEIGRSVKRIEESMDRIEAAVGRHETAIEVLKQSKQTAIWVVNGLWALLLVAVEWLLHGRTH